VTRRGYHCRGQPGSANSLARRRVNLHLSIVKTGAGYRAGLSSPDSGRSSKKMLFLRWDRGFESVFLHRASLCEPGPHPDAVCALTAMGVTDATFPAENGRGVCRRAWEASLRSPDFDNGEPQRIGLERDLQAALSAQDAGQFQGPGDLVLP